MNSKLAYRRYLWIIFIFFFVACGTLPTEQTANIQPTSVPTFTSIAQTLMILPTLTPSPIPSLLPATASPTQPPSPTPRPSPLPVARLELDVAKKKFDLLEQSPNCKLPCFNGLTPGISNDWETQDFFASLGFDDLAIARDAQGRWLKEPNSQGFWYANSQVFPVPYLISDTGGERPYLDVAWSGGKVTSIAIGFLPRRKWIDIPRFLSTLDETPEVFLSEFGGEGARALSFYLHLIFRNHQVQVTYIGTEQGWFENRRVCLAPDLPIDVYIALGNYKPWCDVCDPAAGFDWSKRLGISHEEMVSKIRSGDFCLPAE